MVGVFFIRFVIVVIWFCLVIFGFGILFCLVCFFVEEFDYDGSVDCEYSGECFVKDLDGGLCEVWVLVDREDVLDDSYCYDEEIKRY